MGRRVETESSPADVDAATVRHRARQLATRLRMCAPRDGEVWPRIERGLKAAKQFDPAGQLTALLALADEIRPLLPQAVAAHTLPDRLSSSGGDPK